VAGPCGWMAQIENEKKINDGEMRYNLTKHWKWNETNY